MNKAGAIQKELEQSRKSNDTEDLLDSVFTEPLGLVWAKLCIKLHISANAVTVASGVFGVIGGALFFPRNIWLNLLGVLLHIFSAILDCSDGQVARLTHTSSEFGRILDGISDGFCMAAAYLAIGARLMGEPIPFTDGKLWGIWIWPLIVLTGWFCHMDQCRMADYYRNAHLFFLNGREHAEFSSTEQIAAKKKALPADASYWEKQSVTSYEGWTKKQEKNSPCLCRLMRLQMKDTEVSPSLGSDFLEASRPYIQLTNVLTVNVRAYAMYLAVLLGLPFWYLVFTCLILQPVRSFMVGKYEGIARRLTAKYYPGKE